MLPALAPPARAALLAADERIVVTGAGGWLGQATLELLAEALAEDFDRRVVALGSATRRLELRGRAVEQLALADIAHLDRRPTILLHMAFLTKDRAAGMAEADYRAAVRAIGDRVIQNLEPIGTKALFLASSGAARHAEDPAAGEAMRLYGAMKLEDEARFAAWAEAAGARLAIGRIFSLAGPYINKHEAYALAAFILDALAGRAVSVRAPHRVVRAYVAIRELVSLVLMLLISGPGGVTRFDSGGDPLELGEVAAVVAEAIGPVPVSRAPLTAERVDEYVGDRLLYDRLLAQHGVSPVSLRQQIIETAEYLGSLGERRAAA